jgi:hypothetical protein
MNHPAFMRELKYVTKNVLMFFLKTFLVYFK